MGVVAASGLTTAQWYPKRSVGSPQGPTNEETQHIGKYHLQVTKRGNGEGTSKSCGQLSPYSGSP